MEEFSLQRMLKQHLPEILAGSSFSFEQHKALQRFSICRTSALGGHSQYCEAGHVNGIWYNSCRHRGCPQCQGRAREQWLRNTQAILLHCPHHHVIFTLPAEYNALWRYNRTLMADLLFKAVQQTLKTFSVDKKYLGAKPGMISALHTWGRNLSLHPHIHVLLSHGGIDAGGRWITPKKKSLFPQKPVMMVFRGKFRALLKTACEEAKLSLPDNWDTCRFNQLHNKLGQQDWVVHFCERYEHASGVAKYLARYVRGGPFNNRQFKKQTSTHVHFVYRSHQTKRTERLCLTHKEFIQRVVQHLPAAGKPSFRYYGLYTAALREQLNIARQALGQRAVTKPEIITWQKYLGELGFCPRCEQCGLPLIQQVEEERQKIED